jgi:hypothetical protein
MLRARTILYPLLLVVVLIGFVVALGKNSGFTANIVRGKGNPFTLVEPADVLNRFNLKLTNRTGNSQTYSLSVVSPPEAQVEAVDDSQLTIEPRKLGSADIRIVFPRGVTKGQGNVPAVVRISDASGLHRDVEFKLLGPRD